MHDITSSDNPTYKKLLALTTSKGLKKEGLFLLSGENLIREFLQKPHLDIHHEITTPKMKPLLGEATHIQLTADLFAEIDSVGTDFNILVLKQPAISAMEADHKPQGIELVAPIGDPSNLGALIRSCEAFGIKRVILTSEAAHPFLPKCVKASAGSVLRMPLSRGPALEAFPSDCIALDMDGTPISDFKWPKNGLLVVGEEGRGLGKAQFRQRIRIPTEGVESLNAVVAASIALFLAGRRQGN